MRVPGSPRDSFAFLRDFDGGGSSQVVKTDSAPWVGQQGPLSFGFGEAQRLYGQGAYKPYPNDTFVPFSGQTQDALGGIEARARAGSPIRDAGMGEIGKTLGGDYLREGNPYFGQMVGRIASEVTPQIGATFTGAGRYGSGAHANALASALSDTAGNLAFQNFDNERGRMLSTAMQSPALAATDYADFGQLAGVGATREGKAGEELSDKINRYNFEQAAPDEALRRLMSIVAGGSYGGQQTQIADKPGGGLNDMASGLFGLAGTGLALRKMFGG